MSNFLTSDLFEQVLVAPAMQLKADALQIVSGYVSSALAVQHLSHLDKLKKDEKCHPDMTVQIIHGMAGCGGLSRSHHVLFRELVASHPSFHCFYLDDASGIHSKVYIWSRYGHPIQAFVGSANYTGRGFLGAQGEAVSTCQPDLAKAYFDQLHGNAIACIEPQIEDRLVIHDYGNVQMSAQDSVELPLVMEKTGLPHRRAGLNWGQRPGREPNQAYIPIPTWVVNDNPCFFPPRGCPFTITTDDGEHISAVRAQDKGKAIESIPSNSILGRYFRMRLDIYPGARVEKRHLDRYGRHTVTLGKLDEDLYYLDFSVS